MQMRSVEDAAPLDLTQFVRHSFDDEKLFKYLFDDAGGETNQEFKEMLKGLSSDPVEPIVYAEIDAKQSLEKLLKSQGPGIVSNFQVHKKFGNSQWNTNGKIGYIRFSGAKIDSKGEFIELPPVSAQSRNEVKVTINSYLAPKNLERDFNAMDHEEEGDDENAAALDEGEGVEVEVSKHATVAQNEAEATASEEDETASETQNPALGDGKDKITGKHAMLLLGGRRDKRGRLWLLLQNWWKDMQLVEVSLAYLKASSATIMFVDKSYKCAPADERKNFSLNSSLFADANNFDRAVQTENGLSHRTLDRINH